MRNVVVLLNPKEWLAFGQTVKGMNSTSEAKRRGAMRGALETPSRPSLSLVWRV